MPNSLTIVNYLDELTYQNNRPELVPTVKDLKERKDLLKKDNGENIIFYRGSNDAFTSQFLGVGEQGNIHGAGKGIYGNGTYAAATNKKWDKEETEAKGTAIAYALLGSSDPEGIKGQIVTFGLRADANIVDIDGQQSFWQWQNDIVKQARQATGIYITDVGHAAAAMGIHAYKVKGGNTGSQEEDYWVILNRGAVVATIEEFE